MWDYPLKKTQASPYMLSDGWVLPPYLLLPSDSTTTKPAPFLPPVTPFSFTDKCLRTNWFSLWLQVISLTEGIWNTDSTQTPPYSTTNFSDVSATYLGTGKAPTHDMKLFSVCRPGCEAGRVQFPKARVLCLGISEHSTRQGRETQHSLPFPSASSLVQIRTLQKIDRKHWPTDRQSSEVLHFVDGWNIPLSNE